MAPDPNAWRDRCVGREDLLAVLREAYDRAATGDPQFVVLLGPTGIGKTRLAQELYRWLTRDRDPKSTEFAEGYWPDCFGTEATSTAVNPVFDDRPRPEIPWLWWAIKFYESKLGPDPRTSGGTRRLDEGEALHTALKYLPPHTIAALAKQRAKAIHGDWLWKLFTLGFGFVPLVGNLPGWIKDGYDAWRGGGEKGRLGQQAGEPVAASIERQRTEHATIALDALRQFLDSRQTHAPTIPVVMFLDDAQWIDATTIGLVHTLWLQARENDWPLLVVATHWDDEWEKHRASPMLDWEPPQRLADFLNCLAPEPRKGFRLVHVHAVAAKALGGWVRLALPGLTDEQLTLLLNKAAAAPADDAAAPRSGAVPRVLEQIILTVLAQPRKFFLGGNPQGQLSPAACEWIEEEGHNLNSIVKKRFDGLEHEVQKALGWSSLQGRRFLAQITLAVAERVAEPHRFPEPRRHLERAEKPHRWIQRIGRATPGPGRFNLCEFRQTVFHEIAHEHFTIDDAEREAIDEAVSTILAEWLLTGRLDPREAATAPDPDGLTPEELRDALSMALARFAPSPLSDEAHWSLYGNALARFVQLEARAFFWDQAEARAIQFANARPDGWPLGLVPPYWQIEVIDVLTDMREYDRARRLAEAGWRQLEPIVGETKDRRALKDAALLLQRLGDAEFGRGARRAAHAVFASLLNVSRRRATLAEDADTLRDVSVSLNKVGDVELAEGRREAALTLYHESLDISRRIVERFGESPQSLRDVAVSEYRMARVEPEEAVAWLSQACVHMQIIADRGWATPDNLAELQMLQGLLAGIESAGPDDPPEEGAASADE